MAAQCNTFMGRREGKQSRRRLCIGRQHACLLTCRTLLSSINRHAKEKLKVKKGRSLPGLEDDYATSVLAVFMLPA
jgi:hypothetical protein